MKKENPGGDQGDVNLLLWAGTGAAAGECVSGNVTALTCRGRGGVFGRTLLGCRGKGRRAPQLHCSCSSGRPTYAGAVPHSPAGDSSGRLWLASNPSVVLAPFASLTFDLCVVKCILLLFR